MQKILILFLSIQWFFLPWHFMASEWEVETHPNSTMRVRYRGVPVVTAKYSFWEENWKWADTIVSTKLSSTSESKFALDVPLLKLKVAGNVRNNPSNVLQYEYTFEAVEAFDNIIGGGLEFELQLDSPAFDEQPPAPVLLPDQLGWKWEITKDDVITLAFDKPIANVSFRARNKNRIRTMMIGTALSKGMMNLTMTVTLPIGIKKVLSPIERYGKADTENWHANTLPWNWSPVDLSFLNHKPAGRHGFVKTKEDQLVFEDGTPARFWGTNIAAYALFVSHKDIATHAKRIAMLGYNLVRIHHHDSMGWVNPTVINKLRKDTQHLDTKAMDKLDYWISCLRDQGVYIFLDLHVGRQFRDGDVKSRFGDILGFEEIRKQKGEIKGFCYYNEPVQELMKDFNEKYLTHVNPYTKNAYTDEPAIIGALITNENDLTTHFGHLMLPNKGNPVHNKMFMERLKDFCAKTGLPRDKTWQTWVPGPSKIFLNEQEHLFNQNMLEGLARIGLKVPVATTNYWTINAKMYSLPALTDGGIIDVHQYGQSEALNTNPRYDTNYISWIGSAQVYGKPLTISEWNVPYPAPDRFCTPLYTASIACLQGWDAPMVYNYSQQAFGRPKRAYKWSTFSDPALTGIMPTAAIAFRQGHIRQAQKTYCLKLNSHQTYHDGLGPSTSATIRTLVEMSKVTIGLPDIKELDWDREIIPGEGVIVISDPDLDFIPPGQHFVESDTGEIRRDWDKGIQIIDTPLTKSAAGWIGGELLRLQDVVLSIDTKKAIVTITSLDSTPVVDSKRILITAIARVIAKEGKMPYLSEPVVGEIKIRKTGKLELTPLSFYPDRRKPMTMKKEEDWHKIKLTPDIKTHWLMLTAE